MLWGEWRVPLALFNLDHVSNCPYITPRSCQRHSQDISMTKLKITGVYVNVCVCARSTCGGGVGVEKWSMWWKRACLSWKRENVFSPYIIVFPCSHKKCYLRNLVQLTQLMGWQGLRSERRWRAVLGAGGIDGNYSKCGNLRKVSMAQHELSHPRAFALAVPSVLTVLLRTCSWFILSFHSGFCSHVDSS